MKKIYFLFLLFVLLNTQTRLTAQTTPKSETGTYALQNATIYTITNGIIEKGTLIITDGKISALGTNVPIPEGSSVIDCSGLSIYPGLIDGGTRIGLSEVGSISLTQDYREIGDLVPHVQALTAVNPNSVTIPVTRVSGVTTCLTVPAGGRFPGTAALINLHGYTPEQMDAGFEAVVLNFPSSGRRGRFDRRSEEEVKKAAEKAMKTLNDYWNQAIKYTRLDSTARSAGKKLEVDYNPEMQALVPAVTGQASVLIEVNAKKDILNCLKWIKKNKVKAILTGVSEGWRVADSISQAGVPVITGPILSLPSRVSDPYNAAYANAGKMAKAGIKVAIRTMETENVRNLPFHAGFAATYGMGKEEALKAVTIIPAQIFGVEDQLGSIEKGKQATLFVTDGDPFETKTNIKHVFIEGWKIPLDSRHIRLYNEFLKREPGLIK